MTARTVEALGTARELGEFILHGQKRLAGRRSPGGVARMHAHSDLIDATIRRVFDLAMTETVDEIGELRADALDGVSLAATGGYGRQELSPFSDIDVTFIVSDEDDPQIDLLVKRAYRLLMDVLLGVAGLKIGYSYRRLNGCQDLPLDVRTALLDSRHLAGSAALFQKFHAAIVRSTVPASFVLEHLQQRRIASGRWGYSPFKVEPNIKEGVGGLRDLQTARWIAQVTFSVPRKDAWPALRSRGIISDAEIKRLEKALEFLARVRNALHLACGRASEVLTVERQEEITAMRGFGPCASEFMRKYLEHVELVAAIYQKIAAACCEQHLEIEPGIVARRSHLLVLDRGILARDPEAAIRIFEHSVALGLDVNWEAADLVRSYIRELRQPARDCPPQQVRRAFLRVLSRPEAGEAVDAMARVGILQWLIPEFGAVMYRIPGDIAHELTVGAHSLEVVRQIGAFWGGEDAELREISTGVREPEVLFLAGLLHDIGKVETLDSHPQRGASLAASVGDRLGLRPESVTKLEFLVRNHLLMAETARLRDLSDKRTIENFISVVDSHDLLDMLYLLTAADVRSVGQATWGEVQMRFLRELYHRAVGALRGSLSGQVDLERHRGRLTRELSLANLPQAEVDEHCNAMPAGYLLNTPLDDLASHITYVRRARAGKPVVRLRDDPMGRFTEITICTLDDPKPGLLARIAGVLAALDVNIHAAQVYTRESRDLIAIDLIYVDYDGHPLSQLKRLHVQSELEQALYRKLDVASVLAKFGKKFGDEIGLARLEVMSHLSDQHSVVEIEAEDQPGLLYRLTSAISVLGWNIHSARVSTWGRRARDAFYVTDQNGCKLDGQSSINILSKAVTGNLAPKNSK